MKVSLVIPAYNEGKSVADLIGRAKTVLAELTEEYEVIVVDDGSSDESCKYAEEAGASKVIRHYKNRGYGNALRSGIQAANFDWIVICDADGSYDITELKHLLKEHEHFDMVVGARSGEFYDGSDFRRVARYFQVALAEFVTGTRIPDVNSGFRLMKKSDILPLFDLVCRGFSFTTSCTIAMILMQKQVQFVPIRYGKREGKTHTRLIRDSFRSAQIIIQCILRYNPIKAFLALVIVEAVAAAMTLGLLMITFQPFSSILTAGIFWLGIAFLTMALGFLAYAFQNAPRQPQPLDAGMNILQQEEA